MPAELEEEPSSDVVTTLQIAIPQHATPAHSLEVSLLDICVSKLLLTDLICSLSRSRIAFGGQS